MVRTCCILVVVSGLAHGISAQTPPGAPPSQGPTDSASTPRNIARPVDWKLLIPNILSDQKHIWTFPLRIFQNGNWAPTIGVLAVTAGLVAADPLDTPYFRRTTSFHGFNSVFSGNTMAVGTVLAPVSLYVAGLIRKDSYAKDTALLAGEAVADAEILVTILKSVDRRVRPVALPAGSKFGDTWFESKGSVLRGNGSFPSGHAIAAFSIATVIARRYSNHRWVPFVAYGLAGLVGVSRITLSAHFPSDVFLGAALGYSIGRFSVLRQ
jgi:membrane-associated phospholipid phosphatase